MREWFVELSPIYQALLATLFTWFVTALGAELVFFFKTFNRKLLDGMLGFAAGAMALALGIGIQNFPEGAAVSVPLRREGFSRPRAFWYGQLSGVVKPIAGVIGALAVIYMHPILPYALAFAAGAMIDVALG